jgi:hypothetical protein
MIMHNHLQIVQSELQRYAHPLFHFEARPASLGVELLIACKSREIPLHVYSVTIHAREIENRQFPWMFQKQLYDCLHDYVVEMFTDNPQRKD